MLKRGALLLFIFPILFFSIIGYTYAITCQPPFHGNWTVNGSCTYPTGGIKVYGNINVGNHTVIVPSGVVLGINLASNKVDFSTHGKILFQGTGVMNNSVANRNFITMSYSAAGSAATSCPSGYLVLNTSGTAFQGGSVTSVASSGTIRCGKL